MTLEKPITVDKENKTFTVHKGSIGTYALSDIKKCSILYEDSDFHGKSEPFTHTVLVSVLHCQVVSPRQLYVGLKITMKDESKVYVYISKEPYQIGTDGFIHDQEYGEKVKTKLEKYAGIS